MNINSLRNNFDKLDPHGLGERLRSVRARTEALCAPLEKEDHCIQGMLDVSPPKWHLAHTTWFFETFVLLPFGQNYQVFIMPTDICLTPIMKRLVLSFPGHNVGSCLVQP